MTQQHNHNPHNTHQHNHPPRNNHLKPQLRSHVFRVHAPLASEVLIAGDFNNWDASTRDAALSKDCEGNWSITLQVPARMQHYLFYVDRSPMLDPNGEGKVHHPELNMKVSLLSGGQR